MRRLTRAFSVFLVAVIGFFAAGLFAVGSFSASAATLNATSLADSPLVGSWLANTDTTNPKNPPSLFIFAADGAYTQVDASGGTTIGVWKATGARTADLTAFQHQTDNNGNFVGTVTIRASVTVSADGKSFTAPYTLEWTTAAGVSSGQAGPGQASGTKIEVEHMGKPVMTLQQLIALLNPASAPSSSTGNNAPSGGKANSTSGGNSANGTSGNGGNSANGSSGNGGNEANGSSGNGGNEANGSSGNGGNGGNDSNSTSGNGGNDSNSTSGNGGNESNGSSGNGGDNSTGNGA